MDQIKLAEGSLQLIQKDFGLTVVPDLFTAEDPFERLHTDLTQFIHHLLDHDFNQLLNALYRIDIPEEQVRNLFELTKPEEMASEIAGAIIARQKQKVISRERYRQP